MLFQNLNNIVGVAVKHLGEGFKVFGKGFKHVLSDIIHGRFVHLVEDYQKLRDRIAKFLDPVLKVIRRIRQVYDEWWKRTVEPVLNLIQRLRMIANGLRLLGIKFGENLDRALSSIEAKIIRNSLVFRAKLNEISNIINLVLDPAMVIREQVMVGSIIRGLDGILKGVLGHGVDFFTTPGTTVVHGAGTPRGRKEIGDDIDRAFKRKEGLYAATGEEGDRVVDTLLASG